MAKKLTFSSNPLFSGPSFGERERAGIPYREIPLGAVDRDINQPRVNFDDEKLQELASSIKKYGVLSPILVRPGKSPGRFALIAGERRVRAAKLAGLSTIPAIISKDKEDSEERTLAVQLVENLQRTDLTPLERAHAISALKEAHGLSIREVADRIGVSKSLVQRSLDILDLPDDLINALREGAPESKILLLAKVEDPKARAEYLREMDSLSRKELKKAVEKRIPSTKPKCSSPEDARIADEIQRALGLKVVLSRNQGGGGRVVIEFYNEEDLQEVFRKLVAEN